MNRIANPARRAIAMFLALLTLCFAVLPSGTAFAEDGCKVNVGC